ncbi:hypothetical protein ACFL3Q_13250 [Planctomycetota bacterium]
MLSTQLTLYKRLCTFIKQAGSAPYTEHKRRFFNTLDVSIVDKVVEIFDNNAIEAAGQLGSDLGFLVGISLGADVLVAHWLTENLKGNIATFLPDRAEKYYSTVLL